MTAESSEDGRPGRPALGQPPRGADLDLAGADEADFAREHEETAVDEEITTGADRGEREPESPRGWAGMEDDRPL